MGGLSSGEGGEGVLWDFTVLSCQELSQCYVLRLFLKSEISNKCINTTFISKTR